MSLSIRKTPVKKVRRTGVVLFSFLFPLLLLVSGLTPKSMLRGKTLEELKENPFELSGEERREAELLPPIDLGGAPELFAGEGFPANASTLEAAGWIFLYGQQAACRFPEDIDVETYRRDYEPKISLLADLCDRILGLNPNGKIASRLAWTRYFLRAALPHDGRIAVTTADLLRKTENPQKDLALIRESLGFFPEEGDHTSDLYKTILIELGSIGIENMKASLGEIPPEAAETGTVFLAAADRLLTGDPLQRPFEILYESRNRLLRLLAEVDPSYAPIRDERIRQAAELLRTREEEVLDSHLFDHMFAAAVPEPPLDEGKIADIRFLLELIDRTERKTGIPYYSDWGIVNLAAYEEKLFDLLDEAGIEEDAARQRKNTGSN